jgi:hypothetical protein
MKIQIKVQNKKTNENNIKNQKRKQMKIENSNEK